MAVEIGVLERRSASLSHGAENFTTKAPAPANLRPSVPHTPSHLPRLRRERISQTPCLPDPITSVGTDDSSSEDGPAAAAPAAAPAPAAAAPAPAAAAADGAAAAAIDPAASVDPATAVIAEAAAVAPATAAAAGAAAAASDPEPRLYVHSAVPERKIEKNPDERCLEEEEKDRGGRGVRRRT